MISVNGTFISKVNKCGKAFVKPVSNKALYGHAFDKEREILRFFEARASADASLSELGSGAHLGLIDAYIMLINDEGLISKVLDYIKNKDFSAVKALETVKDEFSKRFENSDDLSIKAKAEDIDNIFEMLKALIVSDKELNIDSKEPVILIADRLSVIDYIKNSGKICGIVVKNANEFGHLSILCKADNISLVKVSDEDFDKLTGYGYIFLNADKALICADNCRESLSLNEASSGKDYKTVMEDKINKAREFCFDVYVSANLEAPDKDILDLSDGIGLYRTELSFIDKNTAPTIEEQLCTYRRVIEKTDKPVIIRTFDFGYDKNAGFAASLNPDNFRGLSLSISTGLLASQLEVIYEISKVSDISILFPMVESTSDLQKAIEMCHGCVNYNPKVPLGIMIESKEGIASLAKMVTMPKLFGAVSFVSIGTNDLSREAEANDKPGEDYVLESIRAIKKAVDGTEVSILICGGLAQNTDNYNFFKAQGIEGLVL